MASARDSARLVANTSCPVVDRAGLPTRGAVRPIRSFFALPHRRGIFVLLVALLFSTLVEGQDAPQPEAPAAKSPLTVDVEGRELTLDQLFERVNASNRRLWITEDGQRVEGAAFLGNVHLIGPHFELFADAVGFYQGPPTEDGALPPYRCFGFGGVILRAKGQLFRCETFFFDAANRTAVMTDVRVRGELAFIREARPYFNDPIRFLDVGQADGGRQRGLGEEIEDDHDHGHGRDSDTPHAAEGNHNSADVVIAARHLSVENFSDFLAEDVLITTCVFAEPHWGLRADRATVRREAPLVEEGATGRGDNDEEAAPTYDVQLEGARLSFLGANVLPLPDLRLRTDWFRAIPLRRIGFSNSSKFGSRVDTVWDGTIFLPKSVKEHFDVALHADYLSARGFGYGASWEYGDRPYRWGKKPEGWVRSYGEGIFWAIDDRGEDRNDIIPEREERNRVRAHHRSQFSWGGWLDAEYAVERDSNFLNEYFQSEVRREKIPENILYYRQPVSDGIVATAFAKRQIAPYRTTVERLPELSLFVIERPLGESGFDLDVVARASSLRFLPANDVALNSRSQNRADVTARLAYWMGRSNFFKLRPFVEARATAWEEDEIRENAIERLALATGSVFGMHFWRIFDVHSEFLDIGGLKHVVDPEVDYRIVFENNVDPDELFGFDSTETVDWRERFTFSLRSRLDAKSYRPDDEGKRAIRRYAEAEIEIDYFPDPQRDNSGEEWSNVRSEFLYFPYAGWTVFGEGEYEVRDGGKFVEWNTGIGTQFDERVWMTFENRYTQHRSHQLVGTLRARLSDRYEIAGQFQYDVRRNRPVNQLFGVVRNFHRWSMLASIEIDEGEDDNIEFKLRFGPRELWDAVTGNQRVGF